jgi:hypothetical protein
MPFFLEVPQEVRFSKEWNLKQTFTIRMAEDPTGNDWTRLVRCRSELRGVAKIYFRWTISHFLGAIHGPIPRCPWSFIYLPGKKGSEESRWLIRRAILKLKWTVLARGTLNHPTEARLYFELLRAKYAAHDNAILLVAP